MSFLRRTLICSLLSIPYCLPVSFLLFSTLAWSQPSPKDFPIHPGCLKPLLGNWESGEPSCYSVNLDDCNANTEPTEPSKSLLRAPRTEEGSVSFEYLGKTSGGVHALRVSENGGGTLTMQSVLLTRLEKHSVMEDDDNQVVQKEKRILTSFGQIWLFGDDVFAKLESDVLTYKSQEKFRTLDLSVLQPQQSDDPEVESGKELLTTADMIEHTGKELENADRELNRVYKELMKDLDPEGQEKLRKSQRAWIAFRDSNAEFMADAARGGTLAGVLHISTQAQMTKDRVKGLKDSQLGY